MNSLWPKILGWLALTVLFTALGGGLASRLVHDEDRGPSAEAIARFFGGEASRAYDEGGVDDLRQYLNRLRKGTGLAAHLVDRDGIDLEDGASRAEVLMHLRRSRFDVVTFQGRLFGGRPVGEGRFILVGVQRGPGSFRSMVHRHLWVLGSAMLFSYLLARYLTKPVERLEAAARRFGEGDLSARVPENRRDELGRLAVSFNQMAGRIQSLMDTQQRLLIDVSHELRSPLTRLGVAVELARTSEDPRVELDRIAKEATRLNSLVSSLLQVTRAEADPGRMKREPVDLRSLLEEMIDACSIEATAQKCQVEFQPAEARVTGDAELLRRAFENILRNAIRHAPAGSTVAVTMEGTTVRIRDSGPGVPEQSLPNLFDAFYRVEGQGGGHGLGLWIARRAVELHKGVIEARNCNPGFEVTVKL